MSQVLFNPDRRVLTANRLQKEAIRRPPTVVRTQGRVTLEGSENARKLSVGPVKVVIGAEKDRGLLKGSAASDPIVAIVCTRPLKAVYSLHSLSSDS